jgi:CheY-like chemotaxis protein
MEERGTERTTIGSALAESQRWISETRSDLSPMDPSWAARRDAAAKAGGGQPTRRFPSESDSAASGFGDDLHCPNLLLIVDDDQDDFVLLERALKKAEFTSPISWVQDAGEAMEAVTRFSPLFQNICVVVDIHLPDMDGFELVEAIRGRNLPNLVRFVFVTGNPNPQFRTRVTASGADGFFVKPCRHSDFQEIAHRLVELCPGPTER